MNEKQKLLAAKHGTPAEFAKAVDRTVGEISIDEARAAIEKYNREWEEAAGQSELEKLRGVRD